MRMMMIPVLMGALSSCAVDSVRPTIGGRPSVQAGTVEALLDHYDQAYNASGHPRVGPASILNGTGDQGFEPVLARINGESDFNRYARILAELDRNGDLNICEPRYLGPLVERLRAVGGLTRTPYPAGYKNCSLPDEVYSR